MGVKLTNSNSSYFLDQGIGLKGEDVLNKIFYDSKLVGEGTNSRNINDTFGYSVAIDGNYCVVGVPNQSFDKNGENPVENSGAAFVFVRDKNVWNLETKLTLDASNISRTIGANFGFSVDILGSTIIVGAPNNKIGIDGEDIANSGAAFIFEKNTDRYHKNWSLVSTLNAPDRNSGDVFGYDVSLQENVCIVSSRGNKTDETNSNIKTNAGAIYTFVKTNNDWVFKEKISSFNDIRSIGDNFGYCVTGENDVLLVSSPYQDYDENNRNYVADSGSIYVYLLNEDKWVFDKKIVLPERNTNDYFGHDMIYRNNYLFVNYKNSNEVIVYKKDTNNNFNYIQTIKQFYTITPKDDNNLSSNWFNYSFDGKTLLLGYAGYNVYDKDTYKNLPYNAVLDDFVFSSHFDGDDKSTDFIIDKGPQLIPFPATQGDVENHGYISTDQKCYGKSSLRITETGGVYAELPTSFFSSNSWGIEFSVFLDKPITENNKYTLLDIGSSNTGITIMAHTNGITLKGNNNQSINLTLSNFKWVEKQWFRCVIERQTNNAVNVIINNVLMTRQTWNYNITDTSNGLSIGASVNSEKNGLTNITPGYYDEIIIYNNSKYNSSNNIKGKVDVYKNINDSWERIQSITKHDLTGEFNGAGVGFGYGLSVKDDIIVVGDYTDNTNADGLLPLTNSGSSWVFLYNNTTNKYEILQKLVGYGHDRNSYDNYGAKLAFDNNTLVVSAPYHAYDSNGENYFFHSGALYVWEWDVNHWNFKQKITTNRQDVYYGNSDLGLNSLSIKNNTIVASCRDSNNYSSVIVFEKENGIWVQKQKLYPTYEGDAKVSDLFGYDVLIYNNKIFATAKSSDNEVNNTEYKNSGSVFIFDKVDNAWVQTQSIIPEIQYENSLFGSSISVIDDYLLVGSSGYGTDKDNKNYLSNSGSAFLYKLNKETNKYEFCQQFDGYGNDRNINDRYGYRAVSYNNTLVVSSPYHAYDSNGENFFKNSGSVYVWILNKDNIWEFKQKITSPYRTEDDYFGDNLALNSDTLVVRSRGNDNGIISWDGKTDTDLYYNKFVLNSNCEFSDFGNGSVKFNNTNSLINVTKVKPHIWELDSTNMSLEFDIYFSELKDNQIILSSSDIIFGLSYDNVTKTMNFFYNGISTTSFEFSATENKWYNISISCTADTKKIFCFVDGEMKYSGNYYMSSFITSLYIGHNTSSFVGYLKNISISKEAKYTEDYVPNGIMVNSLSKILVYKLRENMWEFDGSYQFPYEYRGVNYNIGKNIKINDNNTIIVSSDSDKFNNNGTKTNYSLGSVFVIDNDNENSEWKLRQKIMADPNLRGLEGHYYFGTSIDIQDDIIIVGEPNSKTNSEGDNVLANSGAVWIYQKNNETKKWELVEKIVGESNNRNENDLFSNSIASSTGTLAVSSENHPYDKDNKNYKLNAGCVYIWKWDILKQQWIYSDKILLENRMENDNFGTKVEFNGPNNLLISKNSSFAGYTQVLLNFEGDDGSKNIIDEKGNTIAVNGNAIISTEEKRFGKSSLYLDGTPNTYIEIENSNGIGNTYCIEFNVLLESVIGTKSILKTRDQTGTYFWRFDVTDQGTINFVCSNFTLSSTAKINDKTWHHVCVCKNGSYFYLYIDGKFSGESTRSATLGNSTQSIIIGQEGIASYVDNVALYYNYEKYTSPTFKVQEALDLDDTKNVVYSYRNQNTQWTIEQIIKQPDIKTDSKFGYDVKCSDNRMFISAPFYDYDDNNENIITHAGIVYYYEKENDIWVLKQKIIAGPKEIQNNRMVNDNFGSSISFYENVLVISSPNQKYNQDGSGEAINNAGAAYIYFYENGKWEFKQKITGEYIDRKDYDLFGYSVAYSNNTLIVGAPNNSYGIPYNKEIIKSGSVYVYKRLEKGWEFTQKLVASDRKKEALFGQSVDIHNNVIVVGAPDNSKTSIKKSGKVYIFELIDGVWKETYNVIPEEIMEGDKFGWNVSVYNNIIIASSPYHGLDTSNSKLTVGAGAVWVIAKNNLQKWEIKQKLVPTGLNSRNENDNFGYSIDINEHFIVSSAPNHGYSNNGSPYKTNAGAMWTFVKNNDAWVQQQKIIAYGNSFDDTEKYGYSMSSDGNYFAVGVPGHNYDSSIDKDGQYSEKNYKAEAGAVYLYKNANDTISLEQIITPEGLNARNEFDHFGGVLSIKNNNLAVSSIYHGYDASGENYIRNAGAVWCFERLDTETLKPWVQISKIVPEGQNNRNENDAFGFSLDINENTLVIGTPYHAYDDNGNNPIPNSGAVWVYKKENSNWVFEKKIVNKNRENEKHPLYENILLWFDSSDQSTIEFDYYNKSFSSSSDTSIYRWDSRNDLDLYIEDKTNTLFYKFGNPNDFIYNQSTYKISNKNKKNFNELTAFYVFKKTVPIEFSGTIGLKYNVKNDNELEISSNETLSTKPVITFTKTGGFKNSDLVLLSHTMDKTIFGSKVWYDGTELMSRTSQNDKETMLSLDNAFLVGNNNVLSQVYEIILYDKILNDSERIQVEEYLRNKWGETKLTKNEFNYRPGDSVDIQLDITHNNNETAKYSSSTLPDFFTLTYDGKIISKGPLPITQNTIEYKFNVDVKYFYVDTYYSITNEVIIRNINSNPIITNEVTTYSFNENENISIEITTNDAENDNIIISIDNGILPEGCVLENNIISGKTTSIGIYTVILKVADNFGGYSTKEFSIEIK